MKITGAVLEAKGVSLKAADGRVLVHDINLDLRSGERLVIAGPNGAGKTSLLRMLCGRRKPDAGKVLLDGKPLAGLAMAERARSIALVMQNDQPDLRLTLGEYVMLGRLPHQGRVSASQHRRVVASAVEMCGLGAFTGRRLAELSGGERQRGVIARAIAQEPSLLILDEPTNHLDPRARADLLGLVAGLGVSVIAVLHDLSLALPFSDRVALMAQGRLVACGPPQIALTPALVRSVFAMESFSATNPADGREHLVLVSPAA